MKALRLLILPLIIIVSCSSDKDYINIVSNEELNYHILLGLVVKDSNSKYIAVISNTELFNSVFNTEFINSNITFSKFLKQVLSHELNLYSTLHNKSLPLVLYDSNIIAETNKRKIIKTYFIQNDNNLIFKKSVPLKTKFHLIEYMTSQRYYIIFDDYSGEYKFFNSLKKRD
ncbi:MAG: hypothetical protein RBR84_10935 [Bacteroidales bacterium]|jgi:hypothetical protein|nr:hypothetical protein [Bacteroidales bacterium]